jgi:hypothetical protein
MLLERSDGKHRDSGMNLALASGLIKCRQRTNGGASKMAESPSELRAPEGIRTPNLLIRRHRPMVRPGTIRVLLSCGWRRPEARLSSSL